MRGARIAMVATFLLTAVFTVAVKAKAGNDAWNKKTTMKFSQPFEIPGGKTLAAGTYVFKLLDSPFDRNIVQIFNEDQTHVYATVLSIPNQRLTAADKTVVTFEERAAGAPVALKAWFHPGERYGEEFVYGKARALELAKAENEPVPFVESAPAVEAAPAQPAPETLEQAPIKAAEPSGEEAAVAEAFPLPAPQAASLPHTASSTPLIALLGLLSIGAAFGLRQLAKARA